MQRSPALAVLEAIQEMQLFWTCWNKDFGNKNIFDAGGNSVWVQAGMINNLFFMWPRLIDKAR
jgi:ABC-type glucose/galactose transport system permease subunit